VLFLNSCKKESSKIEKIQLSDVQHTHQVNISYEELYTDYLLSYPECILLTDSFLIIQDDRAQTAFYHAIDRISGLLAFEFGQKGNGPGELLLTTLSPFYDKFKNGIQIFDRNRKSICYYDLNEHKIICKSILDDISQKHNLFLSQLFDLDEFYLAAGSNGVLDNSRFVIFDKSFELKNVFNEYPILDNNRKVNEELKEKLLNIHFLKISPNKKKAVFASYEIGLLEIFNIDELPNKMPKTKSLLLTKPVKYKDETLFGFEDVFVTDNFIYALHNGKTAEDNPYYSKSIKVFDWDGNPIVEYKTGVDMRCLAIDEVKKIIYAVAYTDEKGFFLIQAKYDNSNHIIE
jgi:hypothetical protein